MVHLCCVLLISAVMCINVADVSLNVSHDNRDQHCVRLTDRWQVDLVG